LVSSDGVTNRYPIFTIFVIDMARLRLKALASGSFDESTGETEAQSFYPSFSAPLRL